MKVAALSRPLPGETHNGDGYIVISLDKSGSIKKTKVSTDKLFIRKKSAQVIDLRNDVATIICVVDGIGHGIIAEGIMGKVLECIKNNYKMDLLNLIEKCNSSIRYSRGAVMGIVHFDIKATRIYCAGVGNIKIQIINNAEVEPVVPPTVTRRIPSETLLTNDGIVGYNLPAKLKLTECEYRMDDILIMSSDGIDSNFNIREIPGYKDLDAKALVNLIMTKWSIERDDATVVVMR